MSLLLSHLVGPAGLPTGTLELFNKIDNFFTGIIPQNCSIGKTFLQKCPKKEKPFGPSAEKQKICAKNNKVLVYRVKITWYNDNA
jgi:hypothetical protein